MNKKKALLIFVAVVVSLFIGLIVLANILITPERVRQTVVPLAEEHLDRQVKLGEINVSLFSGISIKDMSIAKKEGEGSFVAAEKVVLRYSLLALLALQVKVDEMTLVNPAIEIIREKDGTFNFSDLVAAESEPESAPNAAPDKNEKSAPIDLHVSNVSVSNGRLLFIDHAAEGGTGRHEITRFNLKARDVSTNAPFPIELGADWNGNAFGVDGMLNPADGLAEIKAFFNQVAINVSGKFSDEKLTVDIRLPQTSLDDIFRSIPAGYAPDGLGEGFSGTAAFSFRLADNRADLKDLAVEVNGQKLNAKMIVEDVTAQIFKVDVYLLGSELVVDKLLTDKPQGQATQTSGNSDSREVEEVGPFNIPVDLKASVEIGSLVYNQIPVRDFDIKATLINNILTISGLNGRIAGGSFSNRSKVDLGVRGLRYETALDITSVQGRELVSLLKPEMADAVEGMVAGSITLQGQGGDAERFKRNLSGKGRLSLSNGLLQSIPALDAVAALLEVSELRKIRLDDGHADFSIKDGKVSLTSNIAGSTTRLATSGTVGLDGGMDLRSQLALSPLLGGRLHSKGKLSRYLGDDGGWTTVPLRIRGSYDSPDVGLDSKGLKKQAEKAVQKKAQEELEKALEKKLKGLFGR